jgi:hypothetical protein
MDRVRLRSRPLLFPAAIAAALAIFHGVHTLRGTAPPRDAYRTIFAELGYIARYLTGYTPEQVISARRDGRLHLFHSGELLLQAGGPAADIAGRLAAGIRPALDTLKAQGVHVVPVLIPTKLSLYREQLPFTIRKRGQWAEPSSEPVESPETVHRLLAGAVPEAVDLYEPFREFRRQSPERLLYPPLDYHWTSLGSAVAVETVARRLMTHALLTSRPTWLPLGPRALGPSYLTDQYPLPHWFVRARPEFQGEEELVRFEHNTTAEPGRAILLGTSFSGGAPDQFLGQLRSVLGRELVAFVRPDNGYSGGFRMMRDSGLVPHAGDLLIWELPLCCLNLDAPGIETGDLPPQPQDSRP